MRPGSIRKKNLFGQLFLCFYLQHGQRHRPPAIHYEVNVGIGHLSELNERIFFYELIQLIFSEKSKSGRFIFKFALDHICILHWENMCRWPPQIEKEIVVILLNRTCIQKKKTIYMPCMTRKKKSVVSLWSIPDSAHTLLHIHIELKAISCLYMYRNPATYLNYKPVLWRCITCH
jgi:hypothetical protein